MSASQAKRIAELEQQLDRVRQLNQAAAVLYRAVPGTSVTITARPDGVGSGRWGVFRHGFDERTVWTGEQWEAYSGSVEWAHRWSTTDLELGLLDRLVAQEMAAHINWRASHVPSGIDEEFAEFAGEVAA